MIRVIKFMYKLHSSIVEIASELCYERIYLSLMRCYRSSSSVYWVPTESTECTEPFEGVDGGLVCCFWVKGVGYPDGNEECCCSSASKT